MNKKLVLAACVAVFACACQPKVSDSQAPKPQDAPKHSAPCGSSCEKPKGCCSENEPAKPAQSEQAVVTPAAPAAVTQAPVAPAEVPAAPAVATQVSAPSAVPNATVSTPEVKTEKAK